MNDREQEYQSGKGAAVLPPFSSTRSRACARQLQPDPPSRRTVFRIRFSEHRSNKEASELGQQHPDPPECSTMYHETIANPQSQDNSDGSKSFESNLDLDAIGDTLSVKLSEGQQTEDSEIVNNSPEICGLSSNEARIETLDSSREWDTSRNSIRPPVLVPARSSTRECLPRHGPDIHDNFSALSGFSETFERRRALERHSHQPYDLEEPSRLTASRRSQ